MRTTNRRAAKGRVAAWAVALTLVVFGCNEGAESAGSAQAVAGSTDAVAASGAGAAVAPAAASDDRPAAPVWELPDLEGQPVQSTAFAGKIMVMDFWATWCPPCLFQIPILNAIQAKHGADIVVIGVAVDAEGAEVVKPYAAENGIEYQIVIGDEGLARKFGAPGFPALAIVTADGKVDSMHVGLIEEADLDEAIAKGQGS